MAAAFKAETTYLRSWASSYFSEVSWDAEAEDTMRTEGIPFVLVRQVFLAGRVVTSEKDDAYGAEWEVVGTTCDGERLRLALTVYCNEYRVRIRRIRVLRSDR
jgi:hypothetical protein